MTLDNTDLYTDVRGCQITLRLYDHVTDESSVWEMFKFAIEEGNSYPQWETNKQNFLDYYVAPSHGLLTPC